MGGGLLSALAAWRRSDSEGDSLAVQGYHTLVGDLQAQVADLRAQLAQARADLHAVTAEMEALRDENLLLRRRR